MSSINHLFFGKYYLKGVILLKTAKKIIIVCLILAVILLPLSIYSYASEKRELENFVRFHIRANSDSEEDQSLKLSVRDEVLKKTTSLLSDCNSKESAKNILNENLDEIINIANDVIKQKGFSYTVSAYIDNEWFDKKDYDGFYLPEGNYDALIIEIGSGEGHNWWCVLYPCVCLSGSYGEIETDQEKVPVRFKTSTEVTEGEVKFDFWVVKFFRGLFS